MRTAKSQLISQRELQEFFTRFGALMAKQRASGRSPSQRELQHFFSAAASRVAIAEKKQRQLDRKEATAFNMFHLIEPDENKFSDILADLLDPKGDHGQGALFLRLLLDRLGLRSDDRLTRSATVHREALCYGISKCLRRLDVLVDAGMLLGIENKIDALDQRDQVKDYLRHLAYCTRDDGRQSTLVYLTPDGRPPKSLDALSARAAQDQRRLHRWSYQRDLRDWLEACRRECQAEKIRFFLSDFLSHIETHLQRSEEPAPEDQTDEN